jgi:hypothetical protein
MREPVTVWIVEDQGNEARDAWEAVNDAARSFGARAAIYWVNDPTWPPQLRTELTLDGNSVAASDYPDIVVLDLCQRTSQGEKLVGDKFFRALRSWEMHKPGKLAFVVLWSVFRNRVDTDTFVANAQRGDKRALSIDTKRPEMLRATLARLWKRVIEEREEL